MKNAYEQTILESPKEIIDKFRAALDEMDDLLPAAAVPKPEPAPKP